MSDEHGVSRRPGVGHDPEPPDLLPAPDGESTVAGGPATETGADDEPATETGADDEPATETGADDEPAAPPAERATETGVDDEPAAETGADDEPATETGADDEPATETGADDEPAAPPAEPAAADDVAPHDAPAALDPDEVAPAAAAPGDAATPAEPARRVRARSRLAAAMRPKATRGQLLAALLCAGLGFGLVVQVQANQGGDLDRLRQSDLVRLLTDVNSENERLAGEEQELRAAADKLRNQGSSDQEAQAQARERLQVLGLLSGTVKATGPGIELRIDDPKGQVNAPTLLDALQELRDAGAEAVQIGPVRVVASTAFADTESGVQVDTTPLRPPYTYLVIGDPGTLDAAMRIPGGVLDVLEQKEAAGTVTQRDAIVIDALHGLLPPQYARPAPEAGS